MPVTAESLLRDWFLPLYPEDARADLARARAEDANPANNPSIRAHLDDAAHVFVKNAAAALGAELDLDFSDASVYRLSAALTREARDRLMVGGARGTPPSARSSESPGGDREARRVQPSALFNVVVHGSAYVGACIVKSHGGAWRVRRPLWESLVHLRSRAGEADLAVFHWWLKSLADDGAATLADRYRAHVEIPCAKPEDLPLIAPPDRKLTRLSKVKCDALHKYLRANLPELRDVGEHFPSPDRFEELGFKHLSFLLVGGGRMLVAHGPTQHGMHAFWLTREGFDKAAFWPCDAFPEPLIRAKDDKLEVVLSSGGQVRSFELLWWGP